MFPDDDDYCGLFEENHIAYNYRFVGTNINGQAIEKVLSPWGDKSPKHDFKVGDKVKYVNTDVKLVTEYPIETGTVKEIRDCENGDQRIYVLRQGNFYSFFNKEDLTLAE